jgi:hypothetical protein
MSLNLTPEEVWSKALREKIGLGVSECDTSQLLIDLELWRLKTEDPELHNFFFKQDGDELLIIRGRRMRSDGGYAPMEE